MMSFGLSALLTARGAPLLFNALAGPAPKRCRFARRAQRRLKAPTRSRSYLLPFTFYLLPSTFCLS